MIKQDEWKRSQLRLPIDLHERLIKFADKNGLSMNSAIIEILEKTLDNDISVSKLTVLQSLKNIENLLESKEFVFDRNSQIAIRLIDCLKMTNESANAKLTPSKIAEMLGETSASKFEEYFSGLKEPAFIELEKFSNFFGVRENWLKHGTLPKFNVESYRMSLNPEEAVQELLNLNNDLKQKPVSIYFLRNNSKAGELLIIKKYNDWCFDILTTPFHISAEIGAGGRTMLKSFFVTLNILYKLYIHSTLPNAVNIRGFIIEDKDFNDLSEGLIHPLGILNKLNSSTWWEDIWDANMYKKNEYWDGFGYIANFIQNEILQDDYLCEVKNKIQKHDLDILKHY